MHTRFAMRVHQCMTVAGKILVTALVLAGYRRRACEKISNDCCDLTSTRHESTLIRAKRYRGSAMRGPENVRRQPSKQVEAIKRNQCFVTEHVQCHALTGFAVPWKLLMM